MHNSIKYSILCLSGKGIWNYEGVGDLKSKVVVGNSTEGEGRGRTEGGEGGGTGGVGEEHPIQNPRGWKEICCKAHFDWRVEIEAAIDNILTVRLF